MMMEEEGKGKHWVKIRLRAIRNCYRSPVFRIRDILVIPNPYL
jgi:hypothetical protein